MNELLLTPLAGDRQHPLDVRSVSGFFEGHESEEGTNCRETQVPSPCAGGTLCLLIIQKFDNERASRSRSSSSEGDFLRRCEAKPSSSRKVSR